MSHPSMGVVFRNRVLSAIVLRLIIRKRMNLLSADIVGPTQPLSFAGATVHDAFPLINLLGNMTLGVGALSYAGRFEVLAVADADIYPDLDVFAAGAGRSSASFAARTDRPFSTDTSPGTGTGVGTGVAAVRSRLRDRMKKPHTRARGARVGHGGSRKRGPLAGCAP